MKKRIFYGIATLMVAAIFSGCGKAPQAEIDKANAALDSARAAGADLYLPEAYNTVNDSLNAALVLVEAENSEVIKSYGVAREKLSQVTLDARQLVQNTETRKEEVRANVQKTVSEINALLQENRQLIAKAPRGKEGTAALQAFKSELSVIEASLSDIETLFESGELLESETKAVAAKEKAASIKAELTEVIAKYNRAR